MSDLNDMYSTKIDDLPIENTSYTPNEHTNNDYYNIDENNEIIVDNKKKNSHYYEDFILLFILFIIKSLPVTNRIVSNVPILNNYLNNNYMYIVLISSLIFTFIYFFIRK